MTTTAKARKKLKLKIWNQNRLRALNATKLVLRTHISPFGVQQKPYTSYCRRRDIHWKLKNYVNSNNDLVFLCFLFDKPISFQRRGGRGQAPPGPGSKRLAGAADQPGAVSEYMAGATAPPGAGSEYLAGAAAPPGAGSDNLAGANGPAGANPGPRRTLVIL